MQTKHNERTKLNYIERALRKSHVNGATKPKLYSIGIGKYLGVCPIFSARGRPGAEGPLI